MGVTVYQALAKLTVAVPSSLPEHGAEADWILLSATNNSFEC